MLEDSCYSVVQEALFEMEEQEKLQQQQQQQNEDDDGDDEGEEAHLVRALSTYSLVFIHVNCCVCHWYQFIPLSYLQTNIFKVVFL